MKKRLFGFLFAGCLLGATSSLAAGQAGATQYPIADKVADKIIQKYQSSTCQQLQAQKGQPAPAQKEEMEQKVIEALKKDPQMRQHFLDRIAGPIVNKMFECGMIP